MYQRQGRKLLVNIWPSLLLQTPGKNNNSLLKKVAAGCVRQPKQNGGYFLWVKALGGMKLTIYPYLEQSDPT